MLMVNMDMEVETWPYRKLNCIACALKMLKVYLLKKKLYLQMP